MDSVLLWDEHEVNKWIASIGYSCFEVQFKDQGITGDVLVNLDHDTLKDLAVHSVGQRMDILKHIYHLKMTQCLPVNEWDYIPPSILYENDYIGPNGMADYRKIEAAFQERDIHLKKLTEDLVRISGDMNRMRDDMMQLWKYVKDKKPLPFSENDKSPPALKSHGTGLSSTLKPLHMLTPPTTSHASDYFYGAYQDNNKRHGGSEASTPLDDTKLVPNVTINDGGAIKVYGEKISNNSKVELEASKNVRLLLDDPCSKVITSALKKYNVMDDWRQYALWIQYGVHDNIQERLLGYDEKPLRISQKLKEAKLNPMYVLKHVKDNKPFIPDMQKQPESNSNNTNGGNNSPHSNYNSHRPIQKSTYDNSNTSNNHSTYQHPKTAITSGRVGYEMIAPVMSSSVSSPTPSSFPQRSTNNNSHPTNKTSEEQNKSASTKDKDDNDKTSSTNSNNNNNDNNNSNKNNNSSSSNPSNSNSNDNNTSNNNDNNNDNDNDNKNNNDSNSNSSTSSSNINHNNSSSTSSAVNQKPPDQFLSDLGLESGVASAIYSIMMEQHQDSKPM